MKTIKKQKFEYKEMKQRLQINLRKLKEEDPSHPVYQNYSHRVLQIADELNQRGELDDNIIKSIHTHFTQDYLQEMLPHIPRLYPNEATAVPTTEIGETKMNNNILTNDELKELKKLKSQLNYNGQLPLYSHERKELLNNLREEKLQNDQINDNHHWSNIPATSGNSIDKECCDWKECNKTVGTSKKYCKAHSNLVYRIQMRLSSRRSYRKKAGKNYDDVMSPKDAIYKLQNVIPGDLNIADIDNTVKNWESWIGYKPPKRGRPVSSVHTQGHTFKPCDLPTNYSIITIEELVKRLEGTKVASRITVEDLQEIHTAINK